MLHELVHNVQGPHNAVFYKLLDEITEVLIQLYLATTTGICYCKCSMHFEMQQLPGPCQEWISCLQER